MLTIFTPVYNRGHMIKRVYDSLKRQKCQNFEWIVIDDGSSDNIDQIMEELKSDTHSFDLFYFTQNHGGKHRAINLAVQKARGDFFFIVDSDDYIYPNAVGLVTKWLQGIRKDIRFAAVSGIKVLPDGTPPKGTVGIPFHEFVDASQFERYKYNLNGDMAEAYRTDLLKMFPFPEFENEYFIEESVVWNRIAGKGYVVRWYNEPIYVCQYLPDGLSKTGGRKRIENNFNGYCEGLKYLLKRCEGVPWSRKIHLFLLFNIVAHKRRVPLYKRRYCIDMTSKKFYRLYLADQPVYFVLYVLKKVFGKG